MGKRQKTAKLVGNMKCFMVYPYDFQDPIDGTFFPMLGIKDFNSKKEMLKYLQKNICSEETRKPFKFKTLAKYAKECRIVCFLKKYRKQIKDKLNIVEEDD